MFEVSSFAEFSLQKVWVYDLFPGDCLTVIAVILVLAVLFLTLNFPSTN